ncbi:transposase, partial [Pseudonocardia oroxyli]
MPKSFPKEFRRDVIAVARQGDQSIASVTRNFGISESRLSRWLKIADREDGISSDSSDMPAKPASESDLEAEHRELRGGPSSSSRRTRSCAAPPPTSPVTCSQNDVP